MENKSQDYSVFSKKSNIKLSSDPEPNDTSSTIGGTFSNLMGKVKGYVTLNSNDEEAHLAQQAQLQNLSFFEKTKISLKNFFEVEKSYTLFFTFLAVGVGLIFLSLIFLPLAWVSPTKFVSLFSLGSLVTLISFVFIHGTSAYLEMLFSKNRAVFSCMFIVSIFLGLYFCFFSQTYYIISLLCAVVQLVTLIIFTLSFIPGGSMGISFITSMLMSPVNSFFAKFSGSA